jgi:hypothetical protein
VTDLAVARDGTIYAVGLQDGVRLAQFSPEGDKLWEKGHGGEVSTDEIALGPDGSLAVGGWFQGRVDFGGQARTSRGDADGWVAIYSPTGDVRSVLAFGAASYDNADSIFADASGDWIVSGLLYQGSLAGTELNGGFVARLSPNATVRWAATGGSEAVIPLGGSLIAGGFNFEQQVARLRAANGAQDWAVGFGSVGVRALVASAAGDRVIAFGTFGESVNLPGGAVAGTGQDDLFVAGVDTASGRVAWGHHLLGSRGDEDGYDACLHPSGAVYFGGVYGGRSDPPRIGDEQREVGRAFVAKYGFDGRREWLKLLDFGSVEGMVCDAPGGILLTGGGAIMKMVP